MTYGPYIKIKTAAVDELNNTSSLLSLVPDSTLQAVGRMRRPYGMGEWQFASYIRSCEKADVSPQRVMQTIGTAPASAGVHKQDGIARDGTARNPYCAAVDLRTRDLTQTQIRALLSAMTDAYFPGWYRYTGSFANNRHIHALFVGYPMKSALRSQYKDFRVDKTALVGHAREKFWVSTPAQKKRLDLIYFKGNA